MPYGLFVLDVNVGLRQDKINTEIAAGLADAKMKARLADFADVPMPMTPTEFGKLIADETEKWGKVIRAANIKPE
jgi:tripartite-type tricarboxylate transporter receptor subunit TctC